MSALSDAAAFLAEKWPVLPCDADKRALLKDWPTLATRDPEEARRLFARIGTATIGVKTGPDADLAVIDLDVKHGGGGLEWLAANQHRLPRTRTHGTRSGGKHLLFRYPVGRNIRNSAGRVAPGVDVRGTNGYVVFPPSDGYSITDDAMPADMPGWLVELLDPPTKAPVNAAPAYVSERPLSLTRGDGTPYGMAGLDRECEAIRGAADGAKHDTLNRAAYSIGGLVTAGQIVEGVAYAALADALSAIRHRCEDYPAAERTLQQAFRAGMAAPRQPPPPREVRHVIRIEMPEPEMIPWDAAPGYLTAEPDDQPHVAEAFDPETGEITGEHLKPVTPLPLIYFDEVEPNLDAADFVEGLLTEGAMSVLYGPSNCGKTFFATDLGLHVAAGWKWRGRDVDVGGVIYCALEGGHGIKNRIAAFRAEYGITATLPFAIVPVAINLLDPEAERGPLVDTIRIAAAKMGVPVRLVVIDTLSRAMAGGNENGPEDMGALVASADYIRQAVNTHLMFIHHSGKDEARGARGHSSLRAATDTEIEITRADKESPSVATVTKQREMEIDGTFVFKLKAVPLGTNRRGKPVTSCIVEAMGEADAPQRRPELPGGAKMALRALREALAKPGAGKAGDGRDIPSNVSTLPLTAWRQEFYARSTLDTQEARKKAFQRGCDALVKAGEVAVLNELAWIVRAE